MNITEDYVSFEVAKLLKEKGFDEPVNCFYFIDGTFTGNTVTTTNSYTRHYAVPTHQRTLKWLREVHNICIVIQPYDSYYKERYEFEINKKNNNDFTWEWISDIENTIFDTYEEAVEAAIKHCLTNLIK